MGIKEDLTKFSTQAGGAFKTISNRQSIAERLAKQLKKDNIQIKQIKHLSSKHLEQYIQSRKDDEICLRTMQNEMSCIRGILREAGRDKLANSERISNKALGISGASRDGTHRAMPKTQFDELIKHLEVVDKGVMVCAMLERYFGLRSEEAVQANKSLLTWEKQLSKGNVVKVTYGSKGGRSRDVRVIDTERALASVKIGLEYMNEHDGRMIDKLDLKSAMERHAYVLKAAGCTGEFSPHSMRYAFACDSIDRYEAQDFNHKDALAMTSMDLGHGDGRGRYIDQVYLRR